jgi:CDGSH-type Zn-finger protein
MVAMAVRHIIATSEGGNEQTICRCGDGLGPDHHSDFCAGKNKMKIFEGLSNSKNMVFNVKKLLIVSVDLTLWRKGKKMLPRQNERQI